MLSWWIEAGKPGQQQLALALDASTLSDRFTVLCISVLYRGCAIPVAWAIVPAWGKGAWKPIWLDLFDLLAESVPSDWTVIVLADRGLYARWLYQHLQRLGWNPYLRINQGGNASVGHGQLSLARHLCSRARLLVEWTGAVFYRGPPVA